jgi:Zn-dependent protease with chaperone function
MKNTPQSSYESFDITKYTPWINLLSKNNNIEIVIDTSFSHTAAINLQNLQRPRIILNPKMMKEKFNYSDEEIMFDIGHELGHFEEEFQLQSTVT